MSNKSWPKYMKKSTNFWDHDYLSNESNSKLTDLIIKHDPDTNLETCSKHSKKFLPTILTIVYIRQAENPMLKHRG